MTERLADYLHSVYPLSARTFTLISDLVSPVRYSKGQILMHPGGLNRELWFVQHGLVKAYHYDTSGKCVISSFWQDKQLVIIPECIYGGQRSASYIEVTEESCMETLDSQQLASLSPERPEIYELNQRLMLSALSRMEEKAALISCTAGQRYQYFTEHFPWSRISVTDTAAYLGLTRETVSQIRNKVF